MTNISKIIIWGHPLHSHTHSYIHNGFYIAFKELGHNTFWFDDNNIPINFDFANTLFITEHQVDNKIPKRNDCLYFVHFLEKHKYDGLDSSNLIDLKCSFRDMNRIKKETENIKFTAITDKNIEFYSVIHNQLTYFTLWATDLLPKQINNNINNLSDILKKRTKNIYFVGQLTNVWKEFNTLCNKNNIPFIKYGATFNINDPKSLSIDNNQDLIQKTYIAPALQDQLQIDDEYIPCRIFKNISYGRMGSTNSKKVYELFDKKVIYDNDSNKLIQKTINFEKNYDLETIKHLMEYVKDNHTYVQRIETLKLFINNNTKFII